MREVGGNELSVTALTGSKVPDRRNGAPDKQTRLAFLVLAPLCMAFILGWNGIGMLKPWPTRGVSVLYWTLAIPVLWLLTYAIFLLGRRLTGLPVKGWRFLLLNTVCAFISLNLYRPINSHFATAYGRVFELSGAKVAAPWPRDFGNFLDWQIAYLPFAALWVLGAMIADRLSSDGFLSGEKPIAKAAQGSPSADPFSDYLSRLDKAKLISVSAEDHYVRIHSQGGNVRFLYRFTDALDLLGKLDGQRIHRSHWVARRHMRGLESAPGKTVLVLSDGRRLPVSASYRDSIVVTIATMPSTASA